MQMKLLVVVVVVVSESGFILTVTTPGKGIESKEKGFGLVYKVS